MIVKKTPSNVDNFRESHSKRYELIIQIQKFSQEGCSNREVARRLGISRNTVIKYKTGDPKFLAKTGIRQSKLDVYRNDIMACYEKDYTKSQTVKFIYEHGYSGSKTNAFDYLIKIENECNVKFEPHPYIKTMTKPLKYQTGSKGRVCDYITRKGVFKFLWMNGSLSEDHQKYIFVQYTSLYEIQECIHDFRRVFEKKHVSLLYLFISKYRNSKIKEIKSFVRGLEKDIDALENAVAYKFSNGFVEGTNNKLKAIKRTMYGRCGITLLSAKMMFSP